MRILRVLLVFAGGLASVCAAVGLRLTLGRWLLGMGPPVDSLWQTDGTTVAAWMALANLPGWLLFLALLMAIRSARHPRPVRALSFAVWLMMALLLGAAYLLDVSCLPLPPEVGTNTCGI